MKCATCGQESADLTCPRCEPGPPSAEPRPIGVTPSKVRYRPLSHTRHVIGWKLITISIVVAVGIGLSFYSLASKTAQATMEQRGFIDRTETIAPGHSFDCVVSRLVSGRYDFEVEAHDGDAIMSIGSVTSGEGPAISPEDMRAIAEKGVRVEAGTKHRLEGTLGRGRSLWIVFNPSQDKTLRVTIRFNSM